MGTLLLLLLPMLLASVTLLGDPPGASAARVLGAADEGARSAAADSLQTKRMGC